MTGRMMIGLGVFALFACGAETPDEAIEQQTDSIGVTITPAAMPEFPTAQVGQLALATSSREDHYVVDQSWDAWVGQCSESGIVQVIAKTNSYGVAILASPAGADSVNLTLPVVMPNDSTPADSSARVAVQIYPEDRAYVLKGVDGTVEIDSVADVISGRFSTRVVETTYRDTVFAAASFNAIPIEIVGEEYCRAIDSPPPIVPGEGLEPKPVPVGQAEDNG